MLRTGARAHLSWYSCSLFFSLFSLPLALSNILVENASQRRGLSPSRHVQANLLLTANLVIAADPLIVLSISFVNDCRHAFVHGENSTRRKSRACTSRSIVSFLLICYRRLSSSVGGLNFTELISATPDTRAKNADLSSSWHVRLSSNVIISTIKTSFFAGTRWEATTNLVYSGERVRSRRPLLRLRDSFCAFCSARAFHHAIPSRAQKDSGKYEKCHVGTSSSLTFESEKSLIDDDVSSLQGSEPALMRPRDKQDPSIIMHLYLMQKYKIK